jgi:hypothetical protein
LPWPLRVAMPAVVAIHTTFAALKAALRRRGVRAFADTTRETGCTGGDVDSVAPGFTQPLGDWTQLPAGTLMNKWRGERMDLGLGVEVLFQQARRGKNVPAGTLG